MPLEMSVPEILAHSQLWYKLPKKRMKMILNTISIVVFGKNLKCLRKNHLNTK